MMDTTERHLYTVVTASLLHSQVSHDTAGSDIPTEGYSHSWVWVGHVIFYLYSISQPCADTLAPGKACE